MLFLILKTALFYTAYQTNNIKKGKSSRDYLQKLFIMKKNYFTANLNKRFITLSFIFCVLFASTALAQKNIAWTGATNNNWSTATNWSYPAITSVGTFATNSATVTLTAVNTEIAVGDKVAGYGIPVGATITAIDAVDKKKITISANTFAAVGTPGVNVVFTFATPKVATAAPGIVDIAVISNGGNPTLAAGSYYLGGLTISNESGPITGSTLTIPSDVSIYVETATNEAVLVKGGNIINDGYLDIKNVLSSGSNNTAGAYAMTFGLPAALPTVATEYTYSGSGELSIDTSAGNNFSGGFLFNGIDANANLATYKLLFNGTANFYLSAATAANGTASTHLMRAIGTGSLNSCKVILGGTGFDFGTESAGANNGLLSVSGSGVDVTIAEGTTINMYSNSTNPTSSFSMYSFGATAVPNFIRNKGSISIKGSMARSPLGLSAQSLGVVNFVNDGVIDIDVKSTIAGNAGISITNNQGATGPADVNVINNGTMTIKTLLNGACWGAPIAMTTFSGAPNLHLINIGTLNLIGSNHSFGAKVYNAANAATQSGTSRITNSGTINTNQEFRTFYTENTSTGIISFLSTPDVAPLKLATFTVPTIAAASVGTTYTDLNSNVHTVVVAKVSGTGTSLVTHVSSTIVNPPTINPVDPLLSVSLTKTGVGAGDESITYTVITTNGDNAFFQPTLNSGVINTNIGTTYMTYINGVITSAPTSVLSPGGDAGIGRAVFGDSSINSVNLLGTLKAQVSGNTTAGVDYDLFRFPGKLDAVDISQVTLDLTGIYTPTEATTVDILTTFDDTLVPYDDLTNQSGAIVNGGPFASVLGLTPGWQVVYSVLPGKVQLVFDPNNLGTSETAFSKFKFNYYPNPTSNQLNLSAENAISKVELFNVLGQKVQSNSVNATQKQLNIGHLQKGIYLMEVSINNAKKTYKIVKQ